MDIKAWGDVGKATEEQGCMGSSLMAGSEVTDIPVAFHSPPSGNDPYLSQFVGPTARTASLRAHSKLKEEMFPSVRAGLSEGRMGNLLRCLRCLFDWSGFDPGQITD